ncbi:MAG: carbohydrate kinase family protein [Bacteroidales bacterium]
MAEKIIISGTGCALGDFLYKGISFSSPAFKEYLSRKAGDGGLSPGKLVFVEELEKFAKKPYGEIIKHISGKRSFDVFNVGGPSLVSLIHASQLLDNEKYEVIYYGMAGNDETAKRIFEITDKTPINTKYYLRTGVKETPFTHVLLDPDYDNGHGERTFINSIGAAWEYYPEHIDKSFFKSNIVCFGGTALVPHIHDNLHSLLQMAKKNNCITVVNTVFDFRNQKENPDKPWSLGNSDRSFSLIDILIMDYEEALRISGYSSIDKAVGFFIKSGVSSFIITNGKEDILTWSSGTFFKKQKLTCWPVSSKVINELIKYPQKRGDTTGCGDNFAGGIIASISWQLKDYAQSSFDLKEALSWGVASGGFCCFITGGTYLETRSGEKFQNVKELQIDYLNQIHNH